MIRLFTVIRALSIFLLPIAVFSNAPRAQETEVVPSMARITYLTGSSAYVDAGREEGLREGDELSVVRGGQVVATLKVVYLSAHRAACSIAGSSVTLVAGDLVRYVPGPKTPAPAPETPAGAAAPPAAKETRGLSGSGPHGRIGVRYLVVKDRTGDGEAGFSQPALDLRLDWLDAGGGPFDLSVDARARRTARTSDGASSESESQTRIYRASVSYQQPGSIQRITMGRMFTPQLAALSMFDGLLYEADGARTGGGFFAGVQPDEVDFGWSSEIRQAGAYLRVHSTPEARRRWSVTSGLIGSYTEGTVNREFLYLQGQYYGSRLSAYAAQEVDFNREWKVDEAEEDTFSATSTFVNLRLRAAEWLSLNAGYDNRRDVRLFRDRITPVTQFDDSMRRGYWGGATARFGRHVQGTLDARFSGSDTLGDAESYSAGVGLERYTRMNLGARARSTRFTNDRTEGWLHSLSGGIDFGSRFHLELTGGTLDETGLDDPTLDRSTDWIGADLDIMLGQRWYILTSWERTDGTNESTDQGYVSVTWRF